MKVCFALSLALLAPLATAQDAPEGWLYRVVAAAHRTVHGTEFGGVVHGGFDGARVDLTAMADMSVARERALVAAVQADRKLALAVLKAHN